MTHAAHGFLFENAKSGERAGSGCKNVMGTGRAQAKKMGVGRTGAFLGWERARPQGFFQVRGREWLPREMTSVPYIPVWVLAAPQSSVCKM